MQTSDAAILELPALEKDLAPDEIDRRIGSLSAAAEETHAALAFYLHEVEKRHIYLGYGCRSTAVYAEERHGTPPWLTWRCLRAARACARSALLAEAFARGEVRLYKIDAEKEAIGLGEDEAWVALAKDPTVTFEKLLSLVKRRLGEEPDDAYVWFRVRLTPSQYRAVQAAFEKVRRYGGRDVGDAEGIEAIAVDYLNGVHDESELEAALVTLDPTIPRRTDGSFGQEGHQGGPDASYRSVSGIREAPMPAIDIQRIDDELERDRMLRLLQLWRSGWRCEVCRALCDLHVDHIESRAQCPQRRWDLDNLATLCAACHHLKTINLLRIRRLSDGSLEVRRAQTWNEPPPRSA